MSYRAGSKFRRHRIPRRVWGLLLAFIIVLIIGAFVANDIYNQDLKPVSSNQNTQLFSVPSGSSVTQISKALQDAHLIRSAWAFQLYVHAHQATSQLQAGTYAFSPSQSLSQIVDILSQGKVTTRLVTIIPGRRIDQVRADLINAGFAPVSVDNALNPANYATLPALAFKPASASTLEGLLWPDSFQKDPSTDPSVIVKESLTEMSQHLTPEVQSAFAGEGLSTYQGIVLSSILIQEVNKASDQSQAAQVFLSRLKLNMPLGSDVTARYGALQAGLAPNLTYDSPYNTLLHAGLPPTPISTINASSLYAATHPASTNWLYFVSGDNGNTYFSTTLQQQQSDKQTYCHKLCGN